MSNILWKSFNLCFSKLKCFPTVTFSPPPAATANIDEQDQDQNFPATTNPTLFKNFNSLYDVNYSDFSTSKSLTFSSSTTTAAAPATEEFFSSSSSYDSDDEYVPDFTSAFASHRFFFSSPGSSNSIFELVEPPPQQDSGAVVSGGVAVQTYSPDPYSDFRKSMLEMIEARDPTDIRADWEFLNELLLCYLTLNPKHTHKFIVGAFADVVLSLVSSPPPPPPHNDCRPKTRLQRRCATSQL